MEMWTYFSRGQKRERNEAINLRRQESMRTVIGDILKNRLTGEFYEVKKIRMEKVTLEAKNVTNKGWFGDKEILELLYEKAENQEG